MHVLWTSGCIAFVIAWRKYWWILYQQVYIYRAIFSCGYPTAFSISSVFLHRFSFFWFIMLFFQQFVPLTGSVFFSICYMFYLHFWGTSFSKQCHLHLVPAYFFADFEQVIVCWRSITLEYWGFLWFFEWSLVVFVFVSIWLIFLHFVFLL